ncbi:unnamed protein product [Meloidogyne enterolobii]|uniref:Uncharacterized protein n=1 Tax=Meloidogyne enterolobii TaxID=390850 RepID=A0ACB0YW28_MELEN
MLLPDLIEVMEGFKAKIEARLNGDGNSGNPFFGGYFTLRRATPEQETEFCVRIKFALIKSYYLEFLQNCPQLY